MSIFGDVAFHKNCGCKEKFQEGRKRVLKGELELVKSDGEADSRSNIEVHSFHEFDKYEVEDKGIGVRQAYRIDYTCLKCGKRCLKIEIKKPKGFIHKTGEIRGEVLDG